MFLWRFQLDQPFVLQGARYLLDAWCIYPVRTFWDHTQKKEWSIIQDAGFLLLVEGRTNWILRLRSTNHGMGKGDEPPPTSKR
jgi:hypothetical protein